MLKILNGGMNNLEIIRNQESIWNLICLINQWENTILDLFDPILGKKTISTSLTQSVNYSFLSSTCEAHVEININRNTQKCDFLC